MAIGLPHLVGALAVAVGIKKKPEVPEQWRAQRAMIYQTALESHDSRQLRIMAKAFADADCRPEAVMLYLRADLAEAPPSVKAERRAALKRGLASFNSSAVRNLASAFMGIGATGAADRLMKRANDLDAGRIAPPPAPALSAPPAQASEAETIPAPPEKVETDGE